MEFKSIKDINQADEKSWNDFIYLTFDVDWCSDEVLSYTLDIIEKYDIKATFFITHETRLLERMRENSNVEMGIHPNFNPLLNGDFKYGKNITEVVRYYKEIAPEAVSARSHSMTQNSLVLDAFTSNDIIFDCNTFVPYSSGITLKPYKHWDNELTKIPYFWEDDIHCIYGWEWDVERFMQYGGIKVFDFHPIHVFLNTEHMGRYEMSREDHFNGKLLSHRNNKRYGTYDFLDGLFKVNE